MSENYLIPQFIIDYLQKSRSNKNPQWLATSRLRKNLTLEIENWFKENEVNASYIWKFFVSQGNTEFYFKTCPTCGKRIEIETLLKYPVIKYCSRKCANSAQEIKEKKKYICLKKYGVEYTIQSKEVREKYRQTFLKKYGVENPFQSKEILKKREKTWLIKYGVGHISQSKEIKQIKRSNHWKNFYSLLREKDIIPLFSKEEYANSTGRMFKCLICGKEFKSEGTFNYKKEHPNKDGTYTTLIPSDIFCPHCFKAHVSKKEKAVLEFVRTIYDGEILENDRIQLEGRELDIFLPSLNVAIEFDGDYWHSKEGAKERDAKKTQLCEQKGIKLLRIKESDWDNNREEVENRIKEFLT